MKTTPFSAKTLAPLAIFGLLLGTGCEPAPADAEGIESAGAELSFTNPPGQSSPWVYDSGTVCNVSGASVHCCPPGMVMTGAHLGQNRFKCAPIEGGVSGVHADGYWLGNGWTKRNGMHSCPFGEVMVGYYRGFKSDTFDTESLVCAKPNVRVSFEKVDGNPATSDGQMHVCPEKDLNGRTIQNPGRFAMTGIHAALNLFNCGS